jgi:CHAD domain-containing protein
MVTGAQETGRKLDVPAPPPLIHDDVSPSSPAAEVVLAYCADQVVAVRTLDPLVRQDTPDSVHQMRVATRRLRSTLTSFDQVLQATDALGAELKWLGGTLGTARDAEVMAARLQAGLEEMPRDLPTGRALALVRAHFEAVEAEARTAVREALDSGRYLRLLDDLDRLLARPPLTAQASRPAAEVLPPAVRRLRRRLQRRLHHAWRSPAGRGRDVALHEARKAAKHARYAAEALSPAFGKHAVRFAGGMKDVQTVLGDHHDGVVARATIAQLGRTGPADIAFCFGVLYQREADRALELESQARAAWKRARRPKYSRWLR